MKKLFLSMSMAAVSLLAIANPPKNNSREVVSYPAKQYLKQNYGEVENLKWTKAKDDMLRADFQIDGENFSTFFDADGKFVATTHEISFEQLPATARKALKTKLAGKDFSKVVHYQSNDSSSYFVEVAGEGGAIIYKVGSEGDISRFK